LKITFAAKERRGVSDTVATVLIVAATLIAFAAVAGYVFGIFGSSSNTANATETAAILKASDFKAAGTTNTFTCGAAAGSYLTLSNSGTAVVSVTSATIVWGGVSNAFTASGACTLAAAGAASNNPLSLLFPATSKLTADAAAGQTYTITISLSNSVLIVYQGAFQ
jgi:FlaG/FlaF family flagellin (archaellin)